VNTLKIWRSGDITLLSLNSSLYRVSGQFHTHWSLYSPGKSLLPSEYGAGKAASLALDALKKLLISDLYLESKYDALDL
jgi:hypothetical protein